MDSNTVGGEVYQENNSTVD
jgi:serine/threonine protein kinase